MQSREIESYWGFISGALDRLVVCLDGLTIEELNWRPLANANSLFILAHHTLANTEENILGTLCGHVVHRNREAEFSAQASAAKLIQAEWHQLRERLSVSLEQLSPAEVKSEHQHPRRGPLTGREVLLVVARHTTEHLGQAELTRDLLRAATQNSTSKAYEDVPHADEGFALRIHPRPTASIAISIPVDILASLEKIAASRDMSVEALTKLYIGQSLRQDMARRFKEIRAGTVA
jgi:hypothetical protein